MSGLFKRVALSAGRRRRNRLSHRNALLRLKAAGFSPAVIYDIGAYRGGWSRLAAEVFPAATFILFEANADNAPFLKSEGRRHFIVTVSRTDGDGVLFLPHGGDASGASLYVENSVHYAGENLAARPVATARLDTLVARHGLPPADLVKLDVQGAELDVIAGGADALTHCNALVAELSFANYNRGAPLAAEAMTEFARHDLRCIDVCELHRSREGTVVQADFLFAKPSLFAAIAARAGIYLPQQQGSPKR